MTLVDRRTAPIRIPLLAALLTGLLLPAAIVQAATVGVSAVNFSFQPESRTIDVGDTVRWTFAGDPHTVTSGAPGSPDGRFDSGIKDAGTTFEVRFTTAGTFRYFCQIHPEQMTGTIVVTGSPEPTATATARPTATPRPTPTATSRATATPRATPKPTPRATATARATATPPPTASPSATATLRETAAPSSAPASASPSPSAPVQPGSLTASPSSSASSLAARPSPLDQTPTSGFGALPIAGVVALGAFGAGAYLLTRHTRR